MESIQINITTFLETLPLGMESSQMFSHNKINCAYSGFKTCFLNSIVGGNPLDENFEVDASKIVPFFDKKGAGCTWWMNYPNDLPDTVIANTLKKLEPLGFNNAVKLKGMYLDLSQLGLRQNKPDGFDAVCVDNKNSFLDYGLVYASFADSNTQVDVIKYYVLAANKSAYLSQKVKYFVGYFKQKPVCTGSVCIDAGVVGIYDIMTITKDRNKGYATALIYAILTEAKKSNVNLCVLQSSLEALNIYASFGFKAFENFFIMHNASLKMQD